MARVTVEDCVDKVPNRFELVMLAAHRAREVAAGAPITVDRDNDKNPVVSLREIAEGLVTNEILSRASEIAAEEDISITSSKTLRELSGETKLKPAVQEEEPEEELVKDMLQIMNIFTAKMNGLRKYMDTE